MTIEQKREQLKSRRLELLQLLELQREVDELERKLLGFHTGYNAAKVDIIIDEVCKFFSVHPSDLYTKRRTMDLITSRWFCIGYCKEMLRMKDGAIASIFKMHRTAVIYCLKQMTDRLKIYAALNEQYQEVRKRIAQRFLCVEQTEKKGSKP